MNVTGNVWADVVSGGHRSYGRYVGRVGALAVALGVGMAVATGQGLGIARAETDQPTDSQTTDAPSATDSTADESLATTGTRRPADPDATVNDPSDPPKSGPVINNPSVPEMKHDSSGGFVKPADDAGGDPSDDEPGDDEPGVEPEPDGQEPAPTTSEAPPETPDVADSQHDHATGPTPAVVQPVSLPSAPDGEAERPSPQLNFAEPREVKAAPDSGQFGSFTLQDVGSDPQPISMDVYEPVRTAAMVEPPEPAAESLPDAVLSYATTWLGAVLSAFLAPSPASPTQPPLFWAVLTWAGREVQQTFANRPSIGALQVVTTSAIAATPSEEAAALIEQARNLEDQANAQRDLAGQIYQAELNKANALWQQAELRYADAQTQLGAGELDAARARIEQAQNLDEQAQAQRAIAEQIHQAELAKARALFTQAEIRRQAAQQLFQEAGLPREAFGAGLRLQGQRLRWDAALSAGQAAFDRQLAAAAGDRASTQRQTALAIQTSTSDVVLRDMATQLSRRADANNQEAVRLVVGAIGLQFRAYVETVVADLHVGLANLVDPDGAESTI